MLQQLPEELARARELMDQAKLDEAFEIIENLEKGGSLSPENQLSALLMKGTVYLYKQRTRKALQTFEIAYQMSQDLGLIAESVQALIGKAYIVFMEEYNKASTYVQDAERRLNSLQDDPSTGMLRRALLFIKSSILFLKGRINRAVESAQECLRLTEEEKFGNKLDLAATFLVLGWINLRQGNRTEALEYAMKSLKNNKELNHAVAIADDYALIARIYQIEGEYNQAIQCCKQSLSIKEISKRSRLTILETLSNAYWFKSNLNPALKYQLQAVTLAEDLKLRYQIVWHTYRLGYQYTFRGKDSKAIENLERSLTLSEKWEFIDMVVASLGIIISVYVRNKETRELANRYFSRLSNLYDQNKENRSVYFNYLGSKAYMMKTSTRIRDRMEAQALFKEYIDIVEEMPNFEDAVVFSIGNLCELLIEELSISNDPTILDEIHPLIAKCLNMAEKAHNYVWLAESKLLQAKLALIQMDIQRAKKLMVEAQRIADLHGFIFLAWGISGEYDKLLDQTDDWDKVIEEEAPLSERIKLASTNRVLERIQGKHAVETPELVDEEPILLLIMDDSGATYFNHPFIANWDHSDLFSSFLSAFNTFSDEIFSRSIDRIRVGENTILINPVESFLACYVIKGQSYPALQKLTRFTEAIRESAEIWQALEKSVKTSEMLELDKPPALKTVIDEIF